MNKQDAIRIYSYLDNHSGQEEMDYIDWLIDSKEEAESKCEEWEYKYLELQQEYRKMAALADSFKKEVDQLREQLSIAEDDCDGGR